MDIGSSDTIYIYSYSFYKIKITMPNTNFVWTDELVREFATKVTESFLNKYKPLPNLEDFKLEKIKQPLFTTTDGKDIYDNDLYWTVDSLFTIWYSGAASEIFDSGKNKSCKYFSTEEAAKEYIVMNKLCLSVNDFVSLWNTPNILKK